MSFEEEFDRIMRQKAEQADFPFDEKHWEAAANMLDQRNAAGRKRILMRWVLPAALLLTVGISAYTWLVPDETAPAQLAIAVPSQQQISPAQDQPVSSSKPVSGTGIATAQQDVKLVAAEDLKPVQKSAPAEKVVSSPATTVLPASRTQKQPAAVHPAPVVTAPSVKQNGSPDTRPVSTPELNAPVNQSGDAKNEPGATSRGNSTMEPQAGPVANNDKSSGDNNDKIMGGNQATRFTESKDDQPVLTPDAKVEDNTTQDLSMVNAVEAPVLLPQINMMLPAAPAPEIGPLTFQEYKKPVMDYVRHDRHHIGLEAGAMYARGWTVKGFGTDGKGLNYFGGLFYEYDLSKKHSLMAGLQYYNFGHISQAYYESVGKAYGFGYNSSISTVTTEKLGFACLPLRYIYHISDFYQAGLGINVSALVTAGSRVDHYNVADGVKSNSEPVYYNKPFEGTNTTGMAASAFLRMKLNNRFALTGEVFYSFTDMFKNYGSINRMENSTALRFGLQYNIVNR